MKNSSLVDDYLKRCQARLKSIEVLLKENDWPDVVRESQEVVELALKALLRKNNIEVPRLHDVSDVLEQNKAIFSKDIQKILPRLCKISRTLRRDRELAFYGSEDLTPSQFYKSEDAEEALDSARWVVAQVVSA